MEKSPRKNIILLKPYEIEDRNFSTLLDANESPFDFDNKLKNEVLNKIKKIKFNRYPDGSARVLKKTLAEYLQVNERKLCIGNGSDEVLQYIITAFCEKGDKVLFPLPSFSMYKILTLISDCQPKSINLLREKDTFDIDLDAMLKKVKKARLVIIAYPNNPTGNCFEFNKIKKIIEKSNGIVVIDEAYHEFCGKTFLPLIKKFENLVIMRSFSKVFSLAGIRIGVAISNKNIIRTLEKVRLPYNVNSISQAIATFALKNRNKILAGGIKEIVKERKHVFNELLKIKKVFPFKSDANFILFKVDNANKTYENLKKSGILVRNLNEQELLSDCLRVTIGTKIENDVFVKELKKICE